MCSSPRGARRWLTVSLLWLASQTFLTAAGPLPRSTPEAQGVSSAAVLALVEALDREIDSMHSLMIVRHGQVIAEGWWTPYGPEHNHVLFSLSKSFTSTAVGLAVAEGKLSIDDRVMSHFPSDAPPAPSEHLQSMRVRDLLTMSTGHQDEPPTSPDQVSVRSFLAMPVPHKPGTHFKYNTAATFMLSALVQKVTGQTVADYLRPRLFEPLGIERPVWDTNFQGISLGGYGLRVRTEDIAKFGQLYLQGGRWEGKTLLTPEWVALATSRQVSNGSNPDSEWDQGYGFQFWRCRHGAYRGDGAFGQFSIVMPAQDTVVAITSGTGKMGRVLDVLWDKFLPALQSGARPEDRAALETLRRRLATLTVAPAPGAPAPGAAVVANGSYALAANPLGWETLAVHLDPTAKRLTLTIKERGKTTTLTSGHGQWQRGRGEVAAGVLAPRAEEPMAGTYGWESDTTCVVKVCAYETPFHVTYRLTFAGDQITVQARNNVAFGSTELPTLTGRKVLSAAK
jgi:CubicO group peptidase (beta-lactamase class C family)